ncbi:hypothetical protein AOLI_G00243050 [Acnodon oligacanthus]
MFVRKDLWRHIRRCSARPGGLNKQQGRTKVLGLAALAESTLSQQISQGVWKLLIAMKQDAIASVVRNDFCILQLAQSFFNKHGNDPTKYEYIRQKLRETGRFLMILRSESSIYNLEEAVKPANFSKVIEAVKKVSGYDEEKNCYQTPSLALKLGHTLQKVCEIIHCRALMAEDEEFIKSTDTFKKLYTTKWSEMISHTALSPLNEAKFNKPSTLPFTHDVQLLHKHLETTANAASENLKKAPSPQSYAKLAKTTLARIIVFNRRRAGEVSKMQLKSFQERDKTLLHEDVAVGLSPFEQKLCSHFCRVEIKGKRGRKVAVLLTPDMVDALTLLVSKRKACGVQDANCFLFARPSCQSHYRGQDCLRLYAMHCGAQNPEHLRSTHLRKHVATLSQILNLKNNELDQVANFLGHDIRVHREYYRLPEATTQLAKISKLLLAMEKGCLPDLQGKSLDDIEIEDEINSTDDSDGSEPENAAMDDAMSVPRQTAADETTEAFLTEAEVEAVKTIMLQYIDQREAELLGCEVISFADTEPEAPTVTTQTFMDEVDTPTVHPLAEEEMFEVMDTEDHLDSDTENLADETTEVVLTEAEVEEIKKFMLEYIDQREAELLAGNESHEDADVEVEAEDRNTLTDTQLDNTKATFSQTLAEIETLKKDTPEIETRKHQEKKKTRRGTRGKGRKIHYKKKGEQVM